MAQGLTFVALEEDTGPIPGIIWWLPVICNFSSRGLTPLAHRWYTKIHAGKIVRHIKY